jgi:hypothetical protein
MPSYIDMEIPKKYLIALEMIESEQFTWLMVGSNHVEANLKALRPAYEAWKEAGGKSILHKDYAKEKNNSIFINKHFSYEKENEKS